MNFFIIHILCKIICCLKGQHTLTKIQNLKVQSLRFLQLSSELPETFQSLRTTLYSKKRLKEVDELMNVVKREPGKCIARYLQPAVWGQRKFAGSCSRRKVSAVSCITQKISCHQMHFAKICCLKMHQATFFCIEFAGSCSRQKVCAVSCIMQKFSCHQIHLAKISCFKMH